MALAVGLQVGVSTHGFAIGIQMEHKDDPNVAEVLQTVEGLWGHILFKAQNCSCARRQEALTGRPEAIFEARVYGRNRLDEVAALRVQLLSVCLAKLPLSRDAACSLLLALALHRIESRLHLLVRAPHKPPPLERERANGAGQQQRVASGHKLLLRHLFPNFGERGCTAAEAVLKAG